MEFFTYLGRFTTPDPAADQYPSLSPYAYCAANPLRYSDPTGCEILINGLRYDIGMGYDGPDNFISRTVDALNLVADFGGSKLLNDLIDSDHLFDFLPTDSAASYTMAAGGSTSVNLSTKLGRDEYVRATAHESMHAAQFLHGQGGASIYNEVEAYAFADYISYNSWNAKNELDVIGNPSYSKQGIYYMNFKNLYDPIKVHDPAIYVHSIFSSVMFFKNMSDENNTGIYDKNVLYSKYKNWYDLNSMLQIYINKF